MRHLIVLFVASFALTILHVSAWTRTPPLIFKQPPKDEQFFEVADQNEDDRPVVIECEAEGEPAPKYYWQKNGKPFDWQAYDERIVQQPGRGTLVIVQPRDEDLGQYQCIAVNELGTAISNSVFLRKAELKSFKDTHMIRLSANEGDSLKLICQPPDGWPKPNVYWFIQNTYGEIKSINNSRMTVDPKGNLWFSYVTKDDASDDFSYACTATSAFGNEYKLGNKVLLDVLSSGDSSHQIRREPEQLYVTRKNEAAVLGKTVELYCIFGGMPLPQIVWSKNGQLLHPSARIIPRNYGKSLVIYPVDYEDEGVYTCETSNGVGDIKSYNINLMVLAAPYFTVEPEIITTPEDERAEFRCEVGGIPEPKIKWIHNGKPIEDAPLNPRRKVNTNSIVIESLVKNDTGNYGCNATNSLGYVYKDVYVNVLALPPEIQQPPNNEVTVDGETIRITCRVFGIPKPNIKWIRNSRELIGGRYTILESGDLEIKNANFLDTGDYTCSASNKFGSAQASGNLVVKEHTTITDKPEDCEVAVGSTATFRCNAVTDSTLTLTINWLSNGEFIDFGLESRFVQSTDYSLTIMQTTELDSGMYTCVAQTELDETRAEASLIVQDVPNPPRLVGVECMNSEASVRWIPLGDNRAPILRYIIQFNTSFTPDIWETAHENIPATDQTYNVPMAPWAKYTFRVLAWNKIGASLPSSHSEMCTTQPDVPYKNPDHVQGKGTNPENIVISWQPMLEIEHNAPRFMYRVLYKRDIPGADWISHEITDWQQHRLQVENQPTFQRYKIKVIAINERGESNVSPEEVIGYSGEGEPLEAPTDFTVVQIIKIDSTTVKLSWSPVSVESVRGIFKGYTIQTWTDKDGEKGMQEILVENNVTEKVISKLLYAGRNYVRVFAYNGRYNGPASKTLSFEMPDGVPGSVQSFDGFPMGSNALYLVWEKPAQPNGILTGYKIYYQEVDRTGLGPLLEKEPQVRDPDATKVILAGLKPNTKYRVHIRAMTKAGESEDYFIERTTRSAVAVPPEVPNFTWERIPTDSEMATIRVTWLPSQDGNPGSHFFVKYKLKGETISQETLPQFNEDYTEVRGLIKGKIYVMSLVAVDGEYFAESLPQEIATSSEVPCIQLEESVQTIDSFTDQNESISQIDLVVKRVAIDLYKRIEDKIDQLISG